MPFLLERAGWDLTLMLLLHLYLSFRSIISPFRFLTLATPVSRNSALRVYKDSHSSYPRNTRLEDSSLLSITLLMSEVYMILVPS